MKKIILYAIALIWSIISVFSLNLFSVNAASFYNQEAAPESGLPGSSNGVQRKTALSSVKFWLGWITTILAILALFMLIYGGILMITAAGEDDRFKKWFTILKQAAVWLIYIGLAWLFIMLVFYVIHEMAPTAS